MRYKPLVLFLLVRGWISVCQLWMVDAELQEFAEGVFCRRLSLIFNRSRQITPSHEGAEGDHYQGAHRGPRRYHADHGCKALPLENPAITPLIAPRRSKPFTASSGL